MRRADGSTGEVRSMQVVQQSQRMYNLTVDQAHTFFVGQGQWLVHNCSKKLADNMLKAGLSRPIDSAAHHIIAENDTRASVARGILQNAGINIDDAMNGVFLPKNLKVTNPNGATVHSTLHTDLYYRTLTSRLQNRGNKTVQTVLGEIRNDLQNGTFPH